MEILSQTWHWSISGFLIGVVLLLLTYFGKHFGMSSNFRTLCSIAGAGKHVSFFNWDWKSQRWNLVVVLGAMIGGFLAVYFLSNETNVILSLKTIQELESLGIDKPNGKLLPNVLFGEVGITTFKGISILLIGGFLVGFGSRYAGGCTSGHAISGLSNYQKPSLKAVVGFFIGGLVMVHFIFPLLF